MPDDPSKCLSVPPCPACTFQLSVETVNCTSWSSIESWLVTATSHIVLVQEHHIVTDDDIAKAGQWAQQRGWKARFSPAIRTESGGTSGGVAILVRSFLGFHDPEFGAIVSGSRAISGIVQVPGSPSILVTSVYLYDSEDLSDRHLDLLAAV